MIKPFLTMKEKEVLIPEELALHPAKTDLLSVINNRKFKDKVLYKIKSDFHNIKIVENEVGRFLHYKNTYQAGFINTDYYIGNLPYINYFLVPYLIKPDIKNILLIGLGTGKLVKDFEFLFDKLNNIDVIDIEENILDLAVNYFDFKPSEKFNFILQDGIIYLRTCKRKYDLIVVDVANNEGIDLRFLTDEYLKLIRKNLHKSGIFVSNMCSSADFENSKNIFFKKFFPLYKQNFKYNLVFKGNYSDKIYYKAFFNLQERVIDVTNVIIISSDLYKNIPQNKEAKNKISMLNIDINKYLEDLY